MTPKMIHWWVVSLYYNTVYMGSVRVFLGYSGCLLRIGIDVLQGGWGFIV